MRLTSKELQAIQQAFQKVIPYQYELFLFGSRADDAKKGGDIDLLVLVNSEIKQKIVNLKSQIRVLIFQMIPEQRIDITVATHDELKTDEFLLSIANELIQI